MRVSIRGRIEDTASNWLKIFPNNFFHWRIETSMKMSPKSFFQQTVEAQAGHRPPRIWFYTEPFVKSTSVPFLRQDPPLDLSFWSFLTFLHHGIEEVERHLLWKFYKKIRKKSWSNVPPKLLACIGFLYKVVHKIGRLRKFNRSREIEFNCLTAWTISMKFGTLVHHAPGYKTLPQIF